MPTRSRGQYHEDGVESHTDAATETRRNLSSTQVKPGDFKNGLTIERDGGVWKVLNFQQTKTARQAAMVRTKLKNLRERHDGRGHLPHVRDLPDGASRHERRRLLLR